jgi:hypothetical protein
LAQRSLKANRPRSDAQFGRAANRRKGFFASERRDRYNPKGRRETEGAMPAEFT